MEDLRATLSSRLIADGAMGTQLLALGLAGDCPEVWNVKRPEAVEGIHRRYVESGAQLLLTNTFGATAWKLARSGREAEQEVFCRAAAENALRAARGRSVWVLGDVGPTGELPQPYGERTIEEFESVFAAQIETLARSGVHGIIIETMASSVEAAAAVRAAKRVCGLPVLACMTYAPGKRGYRTMMGETVADATKALLDAGADAVGANCGLGAQQMVEVVREIRAATTGPVLAKPNAGQARLVDGQTVFDEGPEQWATVAPDLAAAGANIIGGCCGTTPQHIACARERLRARNKAD